MNERTVDAGGVRMLVREEGSGDPVVLLHGFPQTGECWRAVAARLTDRHRVLVPDLPGYGRSARPPAFDAETVAGVLAEMLDALDEPRATIVGHDWGGSLAFALALTHPERVTRLVVTNAPFRTLDLRRGVHFLLFNLPVVPELAFRVAGGRIVDFMLRAGAARKEVFTDAATKPYRAAYAEPANVSAALSYYRTMTRRVIARRIRRRIPSMSASTGRSRRIEQPTLIVWGMRDPALSEVVLAGIERDIPHAAIVRLPDVGHFVPEEAPEELAAAIEEFLASA